MLPAGLWSLTGGDSSLSTNAVRASLRNPCVEHHGPAARVGEHPRRKDALCGPISSQTLGGLSVSRGSGYRVLRALNRSQPHMVASGSFARSSKRHTGNDSHATADHFENSMPRATRRLMREIIPEDHAVWNILAGRCSSVSSEVPRPQWRELARKSPECCGKLRG